MANSEAAQKDAEDLLKTINDSVGTARTLAVTLQVVAIYIFIVVSATTDDQLLRNSTVAVPTLSNATLPANAFYATVALLWVFLHLELLIYLKLLADKLRRFNELLAQTEEPHQTALRFRLTSFPFSSWLGGDPRAGFVAHILQGLVVWATLVFIPLVLLAYIQLGFLPYHSVTITWGHRLALLFDAALILYFWPRLTRGRYVGPHGGMSRSTRAGQRKLTQANLARRAWAEARRIYDKQSTRLSNRVPRFIQQSTDWFGASIRSIAAELWSVSVTPLAAVLLLSSLLIATIPGEGLDIFVQTHVMGSVSYYSLQEAVRGERYNPSAGKTYPVSSITTSDANACNKMLSYLMSASDLAMAKRQFDQVFPIPTSLTASCVTIFLFHRHGAPFHRTLTVRDKVIAASDVRPDTVVKIRTTLRDTHRLHVAMRDVSTIGRERLAFYKEAYDELKNQAKEYDESVIAVSGLDLTERDLRFSDLRNTSFPNGILDGALLDYANLERIDLRDTSLQKASLRQADIFGGFLDHAYMEGASMEGAYMFGVSLYEAKLSGASFDGADLGSAAMDGASMPDTRFIGAKLYGASLRGSYSKKSIGVLADLTKADLAGAELVDVNLLGANLSNANLNGACLSGSWEGATLSGINLTGTELNVDHQVGNIILEAPKADVVTKQEVSAASKVEGCWRALKPGTSKLPQEFHPTGCLGIVRGCGLSEKDVEKVLRARAVALFQFACGQEDIGSTLLILTPLLTEKDLETDAFKGRVDMQLLGDVRAQALQVIAKELGRCKRLVTPQ